MHWMKRMNKTSFKVFKAGCAIAAVAAVSVFCWNAGRKAGETRAFDEAVVKAFARDSAWHEMACAVEARGFDGRKWFAPYGSGGGFRLAMVSGFCKAARRRHPDLPNSFSGAKERLP